MTEGFLAGPEAMKQRCSGGAEIGGKVPSVGCASVVHIADADFLKVRAEHVGAVTRAVHPAVEGILGATSGGQVLGGVAEGVSLGADALVKG